MITREAIKNFYEKYKKNLDEETLLLETMGNLETEETWIKNVTERKHRLEELFSENEDILNKVIYPLTMQKEEITPEIAEELFEQVKQYNEEGYIDSVAGLEVLTVLEEYFQSSGNIASYIEILHLKVKNNINYATRESIQNGIRDCEKELQYLDKYFEFPKWTTRSCLLRALYNYLVGLVNSISFIDINDKEAYKDVQEKIYKGILDAVEFLKKPELRRLESKNIDLDEIIDITNLYICGSTIHDIGYKADLNPEFLEYCNNKICALMESSKEKKNDKIYTDNLMCSYLLCQFRVGSIGEAEFVHKYFNYCKSVVEEEEEIYKYKVDEGIYDTNYLRVITTKLPYLIQYLNKNTIPKSMYDEIVNFTIHMFIDMLDWMPHLQSSSKMSTIMTQAVFEMVKYLPSNISAYHTILKVFINRNEATMLHVVMVRKIATVIAESMLVNKPELFIGVLDTENIADVLAKQDEIINYIIFASLIYDVGKIQYTGLIDKETRLLSEKEVETLKNHCRDGFSFVKDVDNLQIFKDVILGHHKSYDGLRGYPEDYDNTTSEYRIFIDIIKISDCIDAGSDKIGRIYKNNHSFEEIISELRDGAGSEYNPDIVNLILSDKKMCDKIGEFCETGREKIYYETFYEFFQEKEKSVDKEELQFSGITSVASNCMHNMVIDLQNDMIFSTYHGANSVINENINCSFKDFVRNIMTPITFEEDQQKLNLLLNFGGLADKLNSNNGSFEIEIRVKVRSEWRWHRLHFVVVEEQYGIPEKIMVAMDDVDDDCKRRKQILYALERAKEDAKQANSAKSMFISNISHEIRTPMNAIVGMVEIMLREEMPENQKNCLMNIKNSGNALLSIINDILDFSKMESGKFEIIEDEYEMMSLLSDLSIIFLNKIGEKPVELIFDIDKNIPQVMYGDMVRIRQVIINLMNNAIKFTDSGMVCLKMKITSSYEDMIELAVSIKDTGIGIKKEEIPKLFGAFQQVDSKRNRQSEGTGLGLVISKQLVELMGGSISVESEYGKGTEFFFTMEQRVVSSKKAVEINYTEDELSQMTVGALFDNKYLCENVEKLCDYYGCRYINLMNNDYENVDIIFTDGINVYSVKNMVKNDKTRICVIQNPMMESIKESNIRIVNKPLYSINFSNMLNNEEDRTIVVKESHYIDFMAPEAKVLIVDDTEMNLTVAKGLLQPLNLNIDTADNGKTAIEMIQKKHYDLVFMDHKMPVMDGVEATQLIRNLEGDYYKEVPIIALTANAVIDARETFTACGMNDFVAKPIEMKNICSKIKKWLPKELIIKRNKNDDISSTNMENISIPGIPGIDINEGIKNSGSQELFGTLLYDYYKLIDTKVDKIEQLLLEQNIHDFTIEVHALKTTSRMVGALSISEKFKTMEECGEAGDYETIMEEIPRILEDYRAYKIHLKDFVTNWRNYIHMDEKEAISNTELIEVLETMQTSIKGCDMDILDTCLAKIEACSVPDTISEQINKLQILVADFEMEEIISLTKEIIDILRKA